MSSQTSADQSLESILGERAGSPTSSRTRGIPDYLGGRKVDTDVAGTGAGEFKLATADQNGVAIIQPVVQLRSVRLDVFLALQRWEATVGAVMDHSFEALLVDLSTGEEEQGEISLDEVSIS